MKSLYIKVFLKIWPKLLSGHLIFIRIAQYPWQYLLKCNKIKIEKIKIKKVSIEKGKKRSKKEKNFFGIADQKRQKPQKTSSKISL